MSDTGYDVAPPDSPRDRWDTCCPFDPECEHSFLDNDALVRWMDTPITDEQAQKIEGKE